MFQSSTIIEVIEVTISKSLLYTKTVYKQEALKPKHGIDTVDRQTWGEQGWWGRSRRSPGQKAQGVEQWEKLGKQVF